MTVRLVPLNFCATHPGQVGIYAEDGTDRWACEECIGAAERFAETVLSTERRIHRAEHRQTTDRYCPYCNPGYVA